LNHATEHLLYEKQKREGMAVKNLRGKRISEKEKCEEEKSTRTHD